MFDDLDTNDLPLDDADEFRDGWTTDDIESIVDDAMAIAMQQIGSQETVKLPLEAIDEYAQVYMSQGRGSLASEIVITATTPISSRYRTAYHADSMDTFNMLDAVRAVSEIVAEMLADKGRLLEGQSSRSSIVENDDEIALLAMEVGQEEEEPEPEDLDKWDVVEESTEQYDPDVSIRLSYTRESRHTPDNDDVDLDTINADDVLDDEDEFEEEDTGGLAEISIGNGIALSGEWDDVFQAQRPIEVVWRRTTLKTNFNPLKLWVEEVIDAACCAIWEPFSSDIEISDTERGPAGEMGWSALVERVTRQLKEDGRESAIPHFMDIADLVAEKQKQEFRLHEEAGDPNGNAVDPVTIIIKDITHPDMGETSLDINPDDVLDDEDEFEDDVDKATYHMDIIRGGVTISCEWQDEQVSVHSWDPNEFAIRAKGRTFDGEHLLWTMIQDVCEAAALVWMTKLGGDRFRDGTVQASWSDITYFVMKWNNLTKLPAPFAALDRAALTESVENISIENLPIRDRKLVITIKHHVKEEYSDTDDTDITDIDMNDVLDDEDEFEEEAIHSWSIMVTDGGHFTVQCDYDDQMYSEVKASTDELQPLALSFCNAARQYADNAEGVTETTLSALLKHIGAENWAHWGAAKERKALRQLHIAMQSAGLYESVQEGRISPAPTPTDDLVMAITMVYPGVDVVAGTIARDNGPGTDLGDIELDGELDDEDEFEGTDVFTVSCEISNGISFSADIRGDHIDGVTNFQPLERWLDNLCSAACSVHWRDADAEMYGDATRPPTPFRISWDEFVDDSQEIYVLAKQSEEFIRDLEKVKTHQPEPVVESIQEGRTDDMTVTVAVGQRPKGYGKYHQGNDDVDLDVNPDDVLDDEDEFKDEDDDENQEKFVEIERSDGIYFTASTDWGYSSSSDRRWKNVKTNIRQINNNPYDTIKVTLVCRAAVRLWNEKFYALSYQDRIRQPQTDDGKASKITMPWKELIKQMGTDRHHYGAYLDEGLNEGLEVPDGPLDDEDEFNDSNICPEDPSCCGSRDFKLTHEDRRGFTYQCRNCGETFLSNTVLDEGLEVPDGPLDDKDEFNICSSCNNPGDPSHGNLRPCVSCHQPLCTFCYNHEWTEEPLAKWYGIPDNQGQGICYNCLEKGVRHEDPADVTTEEELDDEDEFNDDDNVDCVNCGETKYYGDTIVCNWCEERYCDDCYNEYEMEHGELEWHSNGGDVKWFEDKGPCCLDFDSIRQDDESI